MKLPTPTIPYEGWKIESDNKNCDMQGMKLHLEKEQETGYLIGNILVERLKDTGMSASVLDYLMEHQDEIPASWKEKTKDGYANFIFFWGTIYRNAVDNLCVRCLYFLEGHWRQDGRWLGSGFGGNYPACVSASSTLSSDTKLSSVPENLDLSEQEAITLLKQKGYIITKEF